MNNKIFQFILAAFLFWLVSTGAEYFFEVPPKIINPAIFLPPILGLMWGLPAAAGVYFGSLFIVPEFQNFFSAESGIADFILYLAHGIWIFAAGFLPYFLWHKIFTRRPYAKKISCRNGDNIFLDFDYSHAYGNCRRTSRNGRLVYQSKICNFNELFHSLLFERFTFGGFR